MNRLLALAALLLLLFAICFHLAAVLFADGGTVFL
jgi:hypothetical protein